MAGAIAVATTGLTGCGFQPLYAQPENGAGIAAALAQIDVVSSGGDIGRDVKFSVLDVLTESGNAPANPAYRLLLEPRASETNVAVQQDADVTRKNLLLRTRFRLVDLATGNEVLRSRSVARASYNRVESEFANLTAAQDARRRSAEVVAEDIARQLAVFFTSRAEP